jgi:hypothetical protein
MLSTIIHFKETIDNKSEKMAEDPSHYRFTLGFAALCRIAKDMLSGQSSMEDENILVSLHSE